jgi:hypothetical protein
MKDHNGQLRKASGNVRYPGSDWLTSFLYELMRDEVTPGNVETIVRHIEEETEGDVVYTNGWLAEYAKHLADRLRNSGQKKRDYSILNTWLHYLDTSDHYGSDLLSYIQHKAAEYTPQPGIDIQLFADAKKFWKTLSHLEQQEAVTEILEDGVTFEEMGGY